MRLLSIFSAIPAICLAAGCNFEGTVEASDNAKPRSLRTPSTPGGATVPGEDTAATKLTSDHCIDPDMAKVAAGVSLMLCDGTIAEGTLVAAKPCTQVAEADCLTSPSFPAIDITLLSAADIRRDVTIAGITGSLDVASTAPTCTSDGELGCISNAAFPAIQLAALSAADVRTGVTVAGVLGTLSPTIAGPGNCAADGEVGCVTTSAYKAARLANFAAGEVKTGVTVAGVTGTWTPAVRPSDCSSDGELSCVTVAGYKAARLANFAAGEVKSGVTIAGVVGTWSPPVRPDDCSSDGELSCVTIAGYKAARLANFAAGEVKSGVTIAGVVGTWAPPVRPGDCSSDGELSCVTIPGYKAARLANFAAGEVKSGVVIAGVTGTWSPAVRPSDCSSDGELSCVTIAGYKAARMSNFTASQVQGGVTIAGVTGTIAVCGRDGETACLTSATFPASLNATFTSYNDTVGSSTTSAKANVTSINAAIGGTTSGVTSGALLDFRTGATTSVNVAMTQTGGVTAYGPGPALLIAGTPAYSIFSGIIDADQVSSYLSGPWTYEMVFTGLNPARSYEFVTFANRGGSYSPARYTRFVMEGANTRTNTSSAGVVENGDGSLLLNSGSNGAGRIVGWTGVTSASGTITIRASNEGSGGLGNATNSYGFQAFRLREYTP